MYLSKIILSFFLVLLLAVTGCSSKVKHQMTDFFRTDIRDDNSKMFIFTVVITQQRGEIDKQERQSHKKANREQGKGGKKGAGNKRGGNNKVADGGSKNNSDQMAILFEELFQARMDKSQYCREGYIELDRGFSGTMFTLRGECSESATDEDRKHFL
jgi:hypothetical protein